jgi:TPR repeat protein
MLWGRTSTASPLAEGDGISKNVVEAANYYKLSVDQGDALRQYEYDLTLNNGRGVSKNLVEATKYFKLSADQGNTQAMTELGK